jgi:DNA-directed RNA polymerase specialized sigma24 family protein
MPCPPLPANDLLDLAKLQSGDFESHRFIYNLFYPELLKQAKALLSVPANTSNIVKQCFIDCWLKNQRLSSLDYALGLLLSTINKNCIDLNNGHLPEHEEQIINLILSDSLLKGEEPQHILNYINSLLAAEYTDARKVFSDYYRRQLSVSEIAEQMNLNVATVQYKLHLAFKILHLIFSMPV